jgi:hypothetical protein
VSDAVLASEDALHNLDDSPMPRWR